MNSMNDGQGWAEDQTSQTSAPRNEASLLRNRDFYERVLRTKIQHTMTDHVGPRWTKLDDAGAAWISVELNRACWSTLDRSPALIGR